MLPISYRCVLHYRYRLNRQLQPAVWSLVYIAIVGMTLQDYLNWTSPVFLLGVLCLLQVTVPAKGITSARFAWVSMGFGILSVCLPVKTILYLCGAAALLFVLEAAYGKVKHAAVVTLVIMSPIFQYAVNVFSFPIRLTLTGWAAGLMQCTGQLVTARGNTLTLNGNEFSVDPECMGLNMMETSLLLGIMICCFYQRKLSVKPGLLTLFLVLTIIAALNTLSNLFRIIAVVQFNILPGTVLHEVTGIACLLLYVALPATAVIRAVLKYGSKQLHEAEQVRMPGTPALLYVLVAATLLLAAFNMVKHEKEKHAVARYQAGIEGYSVERLDADIVKLNAPGSLVYIKKINGFYATDHSPMICWKGSGYQFKKVEQSTIAGYPVYLATLVKGNEQLYTAWWYDNSALRTVSQLSWRWDVCKGGAAYSLINVTCSGSADLYRNIQYIYRTGMLNKLL